MRRFLFLVIAFGMICGFNAFADTKPTKLTLWTFQPLHLDFYNAAVKVWNAQKPGQGNRAGRPGIPLRRHAQQASGGRAVGSGSA